MQDKTWLYDRFYENIKADLEKNGEVYVEWASTKPSVVRQCNYLRNKHNLLVIWFEKGDGWFSCFFKAP